MRRALVVAIAVVALVTGACGSDDEPRVVGTTLDGALESDERIVEVLETSETILGQPLSWPSGPATMTSIVLTLEPGEETGLHYHEAPLYALVLDGELVVDYGEEGRRTYTEGVAFMEAQDIVHNGLNLTDEPVKILVLYMGAEGVENTVMVEG